MVIGRSPSSPIGIWTGVEVDSVREGICSLVKRGQNALSYGQPLRE